MDGQPRYGGNYRMLKWRRRASESLLENSLDALFATLFWFCLGGALAALMHRWVNTLDAMWGYKKYPVPLFWLGRRAAGRCAGLSSGALNGAEFLCCWAGIHKAVGSAGSNRRRAASPNGGPVMTAGAGRRLNIRLSERACYHGEWQIKPPMGVGNAATVADIQPAFQLIQRVVGCGCW